MNRASSIDAASSTAAVCSAWGRAPVSDPKQDAAPCAGVGVGITSHHDASYGDGDGDGDPSWATGPAAPAVGASAWRFSTKWRQTWRRQARGLRWPRAALGQGAGLARRVWGARAAQPCSWNAFTAALHHHGLADVLRQQGLQLATAERRRFLAGEASPAEMLERLAQASAACAAVHERSHGRQHADVLVLGAGAAGLAAAAAMQRAGLEVIVLEATDHVGGRACSDEHHFPSRADLGAQRLHSGASNPLVPIFQSMGFTLVRDDAPLLAYTGVPGEDPEANARALLAARQRLELQLETASGDHAGASVVHISDDPWDATALAAIGPLELGVDMSDLSTQDLQHIRPESLGDYFVAEGMGRAIAAWAVGLQVELQTPVQRVQRGPQGVRVEAGGRFFTGKKLLITAANGQLARGDVMFDPPLPAWKIASWHDVPMGQYEKILLAFRPNPFGPLQPGTRVAVQCTADAGIDFCMMPPLQRTVGVPDDAVLVIAYVGGAFARQLQAQGDDAAIAYAVSRLRLAFGPHVDAALVSARCTHWLASHGGAFSAARPERFAARAKLSEPVDDVLFFAGEGCPVSGSDGAAWVSHLAGAYLSGEAEAARIARLLQPVATLGTP